MPGFPPCLRHALLELEELSPAKKGKNRKPPPAVRGLTAI